MPMYNTESFELLGWQGSEFENIITIELPGGPVARDEPEPVVAPYVPEGGGLLRRAAYYAGQYGAGVLLAPVLPYAIPIALGVGFLAEQDYGNDMVQQVADLGAMPGTLAASALDLFDK